MADTGFSSSITFSSGFFAEIRVIEEIGVSREAIETTHSGTTNGDATYIPSDIRKPKAFRVQMLFDPDTEPPTDGAAETVTITFPIPSGGMSAATVAGSGFLTDASARVPYDDLMTQEATIQFSGDLTWTASA